MSSHQKVKPERKSKSEYNRTYYEKHKDELKLKRQERRQKLQEEKLTSQEKLNEVLNE